MPYSRSTRPLALGNKYYIAHEFIALLLFWWNFPPLFLSDSKDIVQNLSQHFDSCNKCWKYRENYKQRFYGSVVIFGSCNKIYKICMLHLQYHLSLLQIFHKTNILFHRKFTKKILSSLRRLLLSESFLEAVA
jgi:hypothetical protein